MSTMGILQMDDKDGDKLGGPDGDYMKMNIWYRHLFGLCKMNIHCSILDLSGVEIRWALGPIGLKI